MSNTLKGKVALVTGGSRGLGAATAEALAAHGADVAISYAASADKAEAEVEKLRGKGVRAISVKSDQADLASAKPLIDRVLAEFGRLDILVNNAGIAIQGRSPTRVPQRPNWPTVAGSSSSALCSALMYSSRGSPIMPERSGRWPDTPRALRATSGLAISL